MPKKARQAGTGQVKKGAGGLISITPNVGSAGNMQIYDGTDTSTTPVLVVPVTGAGVPMYFSEDGVEFINGIYVYCTGAGDATFVYN